MAAASGLVGFGSTLAVVADDEHHLALFDPPTAPGTVLPLVPGALPDDHAARKAAKPDFESLALLSSRQLVAFGSGSTSHRRRGVLVTLESDRPKDVTVLDLAPLYDALAREIPDLNIEGAAVAGTSLRLLQRGNGAAGVDAVIDLALRAVVEAVERGSPWTADAIERITRCDLGEVRGVRLGFTDASPLPDGRLVFSAAAEAGDDTYADGAVAGVALGVLDARGRVQRIEALDVPAKIEGVHATPRGGHVHLFLVTDADDPAAPAHLFETTIDPR